MFVMKFVSFVFTVLYVVVLSKGRDITHLQDDNGIPQKDMFLIREFKMDEDANRKVRELHPMDNGPANSLLMKGEATDTTNDEIMEGEDLKRIKRGLKKSAKKGGGGGGGKGSKFLTKMLCKAFLCLLVAVLVECYPPVVAPIRNPSDQSSISGVNFIYFLGPSPTAYQINAVKEISDNYLTELGLTPNDNPVLNTLLIQTRKVPQEQFNLKNDHVHNALGLSSLRKKRSAHPTYKKTYGGGGGGGGGCCNTCGQCGGGGSGSYSQSQSYSSSSSSSGSYGSGYGKK
ncbi:hypothetical protein WA026_001017 [Henosepilachna vigintioctopunctata]|uniref:Uncharacterized protein n=1 Tax=Henosepilachna vigintioctopunctata TaxID=420089 RepID=A0AAW1V5Z7_9CUCU